MTILIVGLGSIAMKHINAIQELVKDYTIYALRSQRSDRKDNNEGVINIYEISQINMESIDFIIVSNPTAFHYETIKNLMYFNKPLFIEKPLFSEISKKTEALVESISRKNILTYVACNLRFLDSIIEIKNIIKTERINEVNVYCGSYLPEWRPNMDFRKVYSAHKELGGGVHIDLIHELDYIYWLWSEPLEMKSFFSNKSSLNITSFDYANYLWNYKDFSVSVILNYYRKDSKRTLEVITDSGTYLVNLLENTITKNGAIIYSSTQRITNTYKSQMRYFIDSVLHSKESFNTVQEANRILELCIMD